VKPYLPMDITDSLRYDLCCLPRSFFTTYDRGSTIEPRFVKGQSARICAIIVNYKGSADTLACVRSLQASNVPVDAVVVGSTPNDPDLLEALAAYPEARLIRAAQNVGFGRANNLIAAVSGPCSVLK
jgi:hypothetical protein